MYIYLFFKKYHLYICICMYICIHARIVFFVGLRSNATPHTRSHERCSPQARRMCENAMARHLSISETLYSLFCFLPQFFISFSLSFFLHSSLQYHMKFKRKRLKTGPQKKVSRYFIIIIIE
ncbi:hypothetical protein, unlikely [Trypanosoma brucei gambiense DAL972]|uniref:Uncharacterized protein n=1 Tax=Trypanosoma brucei gambiense (strain MHOM/CI/86/DAL972) TaxID=679716 RepID=D0A0E9_TRYB9|nr:hypothetical protein, unlikely [Trypanosoma brucei gambiense DAL972]CBH16707.1 hypothetical protein, unlikely [Trypanosoma brucei gambiense DAL972]|eukprot:XP_011778971.1 hypothetical protein, unlikely [Trypanosoma brucei gambiense DAL972]